VTGLCAGALCEKLRRHRVDNFERRIERQRPVDRRTILDQMAMQDNAALQWIHVAFDHPHPMRKAIVEQYKAVKLRNDLVIKVGSRSRTTHIARCQRILAP